MPSASQLIRRERQIMDIVYELSEASTKVMEAHLTNPLGYSAIRATMNKLETKGFIGRRERDLNMSTIPWSIVKRPGSQPYSNFSRHSLRVLHHKL